MRRILLTSLATSTLLLTAGQAWAVTGCDCATVNQIATQASNSAANSIVNPYTKSQIDALTAVIVQLGQKLVAESQDTQQVITQAQNANTQAVVKAIRDNSQANHQIKNQVIAGGCTTPNMAAHLKAAEAARLKAEGDMHDQMTRWSGNADPATAHSTGGTMIAKSGESIAKYCHRADKAAGVAGCGGDPEVTEGDVDASVGLMKGTYDANTQGAGQVFSSNLTDPIPPSRMPADAYASPTSLAERANRDARDARMSVATEVVNYVQGLRVPAANLQGWGQDKLGEPIGSNGQLSMHDMLKVESEYRLRGADWMLETNVQPTDLAIRDMARMQAVELYVNWERFELEQRVALSIAAMQSIMTQQSYSATQTGTLLPYQTTATTTSAPTTP